ncbi:MAG: hypothetical protein RL634_2066 [Bacteroidota bacterium]|jgi:Domain of unknown function (DUF5606)|nr:hypothetical protein [Chitinophagia bacterium]
MEYNKLISITGFSGLFELLSSKNDGAVVKSLEDQSTKFVSSRLHQFSHLESIEIYTTDENVNLVDIFHAMKNAAKELPSEKDDKAIKAYFKEVYPTMDFERVYTSDMKKMVKWYHVINKHGIEVKLTNSENES